MKLRRAQASDADAILALEAHFPSDRMSARSVRHFLRAPTSAVWVVERAGGVTACLILLFRRGSAAARIYSLVVSPQARGLGLGRRLVATAESAAVKAGCATISLEVRQDNAAARGLYAGLGYRQARRLPAYYDDGGDGLRLSKAL